MFSSIKVSTSGASAQAVRAGLSEESVVKTNDYTQGIDSKSAEQVLMLLSTSISFINLLNSAKEFGTGHPAWQEEAGDISATLILAAAMCAKPTLK